MPSVAETELLQRRAKVKELLAQKDELEQEIKLHHQSLEAVGVGMDAPLVDREGFPRADIDVHAVRIERNLVIRLQNDHKKLMTEVEAALQSFHEEARRLKELGVAPMEADAPKPRKEAFARIASVTPSSPADIAGLREGDEVTQFGTVFIDNFRSPADVGTVVSYSVGKPIDVVVRRGAREDKCVVIPRQWEGAGLLGCQIVSLESRR